MTEQKHGTPADGMECMCCMDDIDDTNYVEYRTGEGAVDERQASQRTLRTSHSLAGASAISKSHITLAGKSSYQRYDSTADPSCRNSDCRAPMEQQVVTDPGREWLPSKFCELCIERLRADQWSIFEESLGKATCKAQQKRMLAEGPPTHVKDKEALPCPEGESLCDLWYMSDGKIHSALLDGAPQGEARRAWWDEKLAFQFDEDADEQEDPGGKGNKSPAHP